MSYLSQCSVSLFSASTISAWIFQSVHESNQIFSVTSTMAKYNIVQLYWKFKQPMAGTTVTFETQKSFAAHGRSF